MSQISDIRNPWRDILLGEPASFRGIIFHVETGSRASGRRTVLHEYPKRNDPYAEDMGRSARRFSFTGYLVYRPSNPQYNYVSQRNDLYKALETDDAGRLIHPVFAPGGLMVMCERYSMTESRDRGGFTSFDMSFVETGLAVSFQPQAINTVVRVSNAAGVAESVALTMMNSLIGSINAFVP